MRNNTNIPNSSLLKPIRPALLKAFELFADRQNHINGIENFWNQANRHLRKFNGIKPENFYWFLKECEWRFNSGGHKMLLKQLKHWYKSTKH